MLSAHELGSLDGNSGSIVAHGYLLALTVHSALAFLLIRIDRSCLHIALMQYAGTLAERDHISRASQISCDQDA